MPPCTNTLPVASSGGPSEALLGEPRGPAWLPEEAAPVPKVHLSLGRRDGCGGEGNSWETGLSTLGSLKKRPALCSWGRDREKERPTDRQVTHGPLYRNPTSLSRGPPCPPPPPPAGSGSEDSPSANTARGEPSGLGRSARSLPLLLGGPVCSAFLQHGASLERGYETLRASHTLALFL